MSQVADSLTTLDDEDNNAGSGRSTSSDIIDNDVTTLASAFEKTTPITPIPPKVKSSFDSAASLNHASKLSTPTNSSVKILIADITESPLREMWSTAALENQTETVSATVKSNSDISTESPFSGMLNTSAIENQSETTWTTVKSTFDTKSTNPLFDTNGTKGIPIGKSFGGFDVTTNGFSVSTLPDISTAETSASVSVTVLAVVAVVAFLTIAFLFICFIRYRFGHKAAYYVNEVHEMRDMNNGNTEKLLEERSKPVVLAETKEVTKEWLV